MWQSTWGKWWLTHWASLLRWIWYSSSQVWPQIMCPTHSWPQQPITSPDSKTCVIPTADRKTNQSYSSFRLSYDRRWGDPILISLVLVKDLDLSVHCNVSMLSMPMSCDTLGGTLLLEPIIIFPAWVLISKGFLHELLKKLLGSCVHLLLPVI